MRITSYKSKFLRQPLSLLLFITLFIGNTSLARDSKWFAYISPGVHLGYGIGQGVFLGAQATIGGIYWNDSEPKPSDKYSNFYPGITMGARKYFGSEKMTLRYMDFQITSFMFTGAGIGRYSIKSKGMETWSHGKRFKIWGGSLGLLTYDVTFRENQTNTHNLGLMGVLPIHDESANPLGF